MGDEFLLSFFDFLNWAAKGLSMDLYTSRLQDTVYLDLTLACETSTGFRLRKFIRERVSYSRYSLEASDSDNLKDSDKYPINRLMAPITFKEALLHFIHHIHLSSAQGLRVFTDLARASAETFAPESY